MRAVLAIIGLLAAVPVDAVVRTPARPVTDPRSIESPSNPAAGPIPIADLGFSRGLLSAAWGADGRQLFVSTNLTGRYNIWRTDIVGSWPVQLTQADDRQLGLLVAPDGKTVYFSQDVGGNEQYDIYAVPAAGGVATNLTNTPDIRETTELVAPDGKSIAITVKAKTRGQTDLAILDLATRRVRALTNEADPRWDWSPVAWVDGSAAIIANRRFADSTVAEVWRIDATTGKAARLLGKPKTVYTAADATRDGATLAVTTNEDTGQLHAGVYATATARFRGLKPTPWEQRAGAFAPDGRSMIVDTGIDGRNEFSVVDVATLAERLLPLPPGANYLVSSPSFTPDSKKLLVFHTGATSPGAPVVVDLATGEVAAPIRLAMASLGPVTLPRSAVVTYKSFDGTLISGIVTIPFNLNRDGSNPAVVVPHGGPTGQADDAFNKTAAALASRGYLVIQPNPRGSTGYGHDFQVANYQDLGGGDLKDELAAKDFLVATGFVDAGKVGITGGSYGGFMTLMAIGRAPDAFAAAVQMFGIIDWRTMWAHEDAGLQAYQKTLLGDPATNPAVYDAVSPLTYIKAAKAPLLSLQGENDIRVPRGQAQQVTDAIRGKGGIAEVVFYPGEGHGFAKRETQVDSLRRTIDWFDKYLKGARR